MTIVTESTTYSLSVDAFNLYDGDGGSIHYVDDPDLFINYRTLGTLAGLIVLELGIDGDRAHRVRTDVRRFAEDAESFTYGGDPLKALDDAIEALTAVREQLQRGMGTGPADPTA